MTIRTLSAIFFLFYGLSIPIAAQDFMLQNVVASVAMMISCFIIALLLWSGRALLLNLIIAYQVLRIYLIRPYVDIFLPELNGTQINHINSINSFYSSSDAATVYLSLLSLLFAWFVGLHISQSIQTKSVCLPKIFRQVGGIVSKGGLEFWLVWVILTVLNYKPATDLYQGISTGESSPLFAFGLLSTFTISLICFFTYLRSKSREGGKASFLLLFPVLYTTIEGSMNGSRSALFVFVIYGLIYWLCLNFNRRIDRRDIKRIIFMFLLFPIVIFTGLIAQLLRPILQYSNDSKAVAEALWQGLDISNPNNPLFNTIYFGLTELLHRLSSLKAQFYIMNDRFIHEPWEMYNPIETLMRIINDLLPGELFTDILTINKLFDYIYLDNLVTYNSEMWSIQGSLYLYFGFWLSPIVVFIFAFMISRYRHAISFLAKSSPAYAVLFILAFNGLLENGTLERVIPVNVVRPLVSIFVIVFMVRVMRSFILKLQRLLSQKKQ